MEKMYLILSVSMLFVLGVAWSKDDFLNILVKVSLLLLSFIGAVILLQKCNILN
jgi:hypothetical protein